ncbi:hypothetical protein HK104_011072 [Borealophlyctis nickersoniae]|nr:hypothetical protein HK104_011072 [Borealophlyctis nickersoniae]
MFVRYPSGRISIAEFQASSYFDNLLISTIKYLDTFVEKTQVQRAQFLKGLVRVLPQFSERVLHRKILPALLQEAKDPLMAPFILPNVFWISERMQEKDFVERVLPSLKPLFRLHDPPQAVLLLLSRVDLFLKKSPSAEMFRQDIMPLIYGALDLPVPQVQEQALKVIPTVLERLDFSAIKNVLFPKVQILYLKTNVLSVKVNTLIVLHALIKSLDKFTLVEKIIPLLKQNQTREPGILMAVLAVYDELAKHLEKDVVAQEILPELWKMCLDQVLGPAQFAKFMKVIKDLSNKIEEQHMKFLENIKSMEAPVSTGGDPMTDFQKLVHGPKAGGTAPTKAATTKVDPEMPFDVPDMSRTTAKLLPTTQ